ncbi:hypothetical protein BBK82_41405 [Lentzea guizhouensis]|uniref:Uncharacterized protein n=1 Tax=Lentzea guizhouensis TaxID=1586287 RepID=A0A1B2HUP2_9PSEU|nr:hypothetical protein [Lentzea guizhouensis]ANZ41459.1 hypothetical protein BBK82_41405 [Lentzea guizhouensis]
MTGVQRRTLLLATAAAGVAAALPTTAASAATGPSELDELVRAAEQRHGRVRTGTPSRNGWEMEKVADDRGNVHMRLVPGAPLPGVQIRLGAPAAVLVHLVHRFHCEVDELHDGDVVGWHSPSSVQRWLPESNLASGTAVRIRPGHHPVGTRGGFHPPQVQAIRGIIADLGNIVRWGGDDTAADEALFYLDIGPDDRRLAQVVRRMRL